MCNYVDNLYDAKTTSTLASNRYNTSKLAKVRHKITKSGAGEDKDVLPKFLPFEGKYVSVGAVWRHNAPQEATKGHRILFTPSHNARCRDSTIGALEGSDRTFTNKIGAISTTLGGSQQLLGNVIISKISYAHARSW